MESKHISVFLTEAVNNNNNNNKLFHTSLLFAEPSNKNFKVGIYKLLFVKKVEHAKQSFFKVIFVNKQLFCWANQNSCHHFTSAD